ncbi:MAG: hypothetical protein Q9173_002127 [Seirophora scorigena]
MYAVRSGDFRAPPAVRDSEADTRTQRKRSPSAPDVMTAETIIPHGREQRLKVAREELKKRLQQELAETETETASDDTDYDETLGTSGPSRRSQNTKESHFFTKYVLHESRLLQTITEESRSSVSYILSVEGDGLRRDRSRLRSILRKLPSYYNPCRLDAKITELDRYLEGSDSVHTCFRERLWEIRDVFEAFRARRMGRDIPALGHLIELEREVQIAHHAQQNISEFSRLLLKENIEEHVKAAVRTGLYFAEDAATTAFDPSNREIFEELKGDLSTVEQLLRVNPPKPEPAASNPSEAVAYADAKAIQRYLEHVFALRYQHMGFSDQYRHRFDETGVRPFTAYLQWRIRRDHAAGLAIARSQGLHPIELEKVFQPRLDRVLERLEVDAEYVKARLLDLDSIWSWVNGYNRMAQDAQWSTLAGQFLDDRAAFKKIFPGPCVYCNPNLGVLESNTKGKIHLGIIQLQGRYFTRNVSPTDFKLSETAKRIDRRFSEEQKRLRKERFQQERISFKPCRLTRLKEWIERQRNTIDV